MTSHFSAGSSPRSSRTGGQVLTEAPDAVQDAVRLLAQLVEALRCLRRHLGAAGGEHVETAGDAGEGLRGVVMELAGDAQPLAFLGLENLRDVEAEVLLHLPLLRHVSHDHLHPYSLATPDNEARHELHDRLCPIAPRYAELIGPPRRLAGP